MESIIVDALNPPLLTQLLVIVFFLKEKIEDLRYYIVIA